jgi:hypothetical protein
MWRRVDLVWTDVSEERIAAATCSRWFLAYGFFYREDRGDTFLRNVVSHKIYPATHSRRRHSTSHRLENLKPYINKSILPFSGQSSLGGVDCSSFTGPHFGNYRPHLDEIWQPRCAAKFTWRDTSIYVIGLMVISVSEELAASLFRP